MRVATSDVICLFLLNTKTSAQRFGAPIETPFIITSWLLELQKYLALDGIDSYVWHRGIVWCRTEQGLTLMFVLIYLD